MKKLVVFLCVVSLLASISGCKFQIQKPDTPEVTTKVTAVSETTAITTTTTTATTTKQSTTTAAPETTSTTTAPPAAKNQ